MPFLTSLLLGAVLTADSTTPPRPGGVYNGRQGQTTVRIPQLDDLPLVDGTLDDPVWGQAAVLTGFSEYTPVDGLPAEDSTEVLVWYSHKAIYLGIRAFEPHGVVHYKLADRDKIDADDNVQIILSPFLTARPYAVSYPEKRPFFLDGLEQYNTPNNLIYTRAIEAPIAAAKLTGKVGGVTVAYLGAQDQEDSSVTGAGHPIDNILRVWDDLGSASQVGGALTDKEQGCAFNRMGSADARFAFAKLYTLAFQAATSLTRDSGGTGTSAGPLWYARFTRAGRTCGLDYIMRQVDP